MLSTGWQKTDFSDCSQYLCKSVADFKKKKPIIRTFDLNVPIKKLKEIKERILSLVLSSSRENISADKGACLNVTFQKNFTNVEVGSRFLHSTVEVFTESLCVREIQLLFCL